MKDLTPKLAHAARKVCVGSLHDDVVVIAYLAPRMTAPVEALADLSEEIDPRPPVGIVTVDHLAPIAARGHVVHTAGKPVTHRPGTWDEQMKDLTRKPRRLFQSEVYTQRKFPKGGGREAAYWLPLLALFTGARVEELAQLMVADVRHDDTLGHYLSITDDAAHAQLKNAASRRRIPLHPQLLDCGFLDYVARARRPGLLFPELRANGRGKLGGYFSTWFSIYLRNKVGITDSRKVFHSFRHTFKDACRAVGIEEEAHDALSGHTQQRASRRYGNEQYPLEPLFEAVSRLEFSGLDIAHLYTRPPSQRPCVTDLRMISAYHGIIVALPMPKTKKPTAPFLLAMYEGLEAGFDIAANKPIFGELPRNKQMLVNAWIELHKEELMANWHAGRLSGEFFKLDPLR